MIGTPIWLGHPSSICQRVLERLDAFIGEEDDQGRIISTDRVAILATVGNEDGAHHVAAEVYQALVDVGFTIPANGQVYWVGRGHGQRRLQGPRQAAGEGGADDRRRGPPRRPPRPGAGRIALSARLVRFVLPPARRVGQHGSRPGAGGATIGCHEGAVEVSAVGMTARAEIRRRRGALLLLALFIGLAGAAVHATAAASFRSRSSFDRFVGDRPAAEHRRRAADAGGRRSWRVAWPVLPGVEGVDAHRLRRGAAGWAGIPFVDGIAFARVASAGVPIDADVGVSGRDLDPTRARRGRPEPGHGRRARRRPG